MGELLLLLLLGEVGYAYYAIEHTDCPMLRLLGRSKSIRRRASIS